jgi:hypothetical protein
MAQVVTKSKDRVLRVGADGDDLVLIERIAYLPKGFSKRKWDEQRVLITRNELKKLAKTFAA